MPKVLPSPSFQLHNRIGEGVVIWRRHLFEDLDTINGGSVTRGPSTLQSTLASCDKWYPVLDILRLWTVRVNDIKSSALELKNLEVGFLSYFKGCRVKNKCGRRTNKMCCVKFCIKGDASRTNCIFFNCL